MLQTKCIKQLGLSTNQALARSTGALTALDAKAGTQKISARGSRTSEGAVESLDFLRWCVRKWETPLSPGCPPGKRGRLGEGGAAEARGRAHRERTWTRGASWAHAGRVGRAQTPQRERSVRGKSLTSFVADGKSGGSPMLKDFPDLAGGEMLVDVIFNIIELNLSGSGRSALVTESMLVK